MVLLQVHALLVPFVFQSLQLHSLCKGQHILSSRGHAAQWNHWVSKKLPVLLCWLAWNDKKENHHALLRQYKCTLQDTADLPHSRCQWTHPTVVRKTLAYSCHSLIFNILSHIWYLLLDGVTGQRHSIYSYFHRLLFPPNNSINNN